MIVKILIVYIYGGEIFEGVFDESIWYVFIKLVYWYFVVVEFYCKCVI